MKTQASQLMGHYWLKSRNFKTLILVDTFGDIFTLIKDLVTDDIRKMFLSSTYGFDVYAIKVKPTFEATIRANSDWLQVI